MNEKAEIKHSAVSLAADLYFTGYGNNNSQPWIIVRMSDMQAEYPTLKPSSCASKASSAAPADASAPRNGVPVQGFKAQTVSGKSPADDGRFGIIPVICNGTAPSLRAAGGRDRRGGMPCFTISVVGRFRNSASMARQNNLPAARLFNAAVNPIQHDGVIHQAAARRAG